MSFSISAATICFIACHGGPADHFATFSNELSQRGYHIEIYASGPALKKLQDLGIRGVTPFEIGEKTAEQLAQKCAHSAAVITDVGHEFDAVIQQALKDKAPEVLRLAYYDNPEPHVPGGYSETAAKVMRAAQGVLFANANLAQSNMAGEKKIGIGYYPLAKADEIAKRRKTDQTALRTDLFKRWNLVDRGQKILVYAGGNNEEYFSKALPAFLKFLAEAAEEEDLSNYVVMLQQHPGAKEKNLDRKQINDWMIKAPPIFMSEMSSDDAQVVADGMLYYQTSMGPQFALAGIPTIQVGHNTYEDLVVKNGVCPSVTSTKGLLDALGNLKADGSTKEAIVEGLGLHSDWADRLEKSLSLN